MSRAAPRRKPRIGDRRVALIGIGALVAVLYITFGSLNLFSSPYELRAEVRSAMQVRANNPVRIAGVDVGRITGVEAAGGGKAVVVMELDDVALPIREDATVRIEPRLALEGNNYVRLAPGTPSADELESGSTLPLGQTSGTPQIDETLSVFGKGTRENLQEFVAVWGEGLGAGETGTSGAEGLRRATSSLDRNLEHMTRVLDAVRGRQPGDLRQAVGSTGDATAQLAFDPERLSALVSGVDRTASALVAAPGSLSESVVNLESVLETAPSALTSIDAALPELEEFARTVEPGLDAAAREIPAVVRLVRQLHRASRSELPGAVGAAANLVSELPYVEGLLTEMLPYVDQVGSCIGEKLVPAISQEIPDPLHSTGRPVYQDAVHGWTTLSASNPTFDANGRNLKGGAAAGERMLPTVIPGFDTVVSGLGPEILGVAPKWLGVNVVPPFEPGIDCREQDLPDFSQRIATGFPSSLTDLGPAPDPTGEIAKLDLVKLGKDVEKLRRELARERKASR